MARIRTIKPDFFRHEKLQDLEAENPGKHCMLVFAGLWGHCDKFGRFEWRPRQLKLDILPFLDFTMAETLHKLAQSDLILRYTVEGKEYGEIKSFAKHQRISGKELQEQGRYPAPPKSIVEKNTGNTGEVYGKDLPAQEGNGSMGREGKGREGMQGEGREVCPMPVADAPDTGPATGSAVIEIPIVGSGEPTYAVTEDDLAEWTEAFPGVDVMQALRALRQWNLAKPSRRKTARGVRAHIVSWLTRDQDRGPAARANGGNGYQPSDPLVEHRAINARRRAALAEEAALREPPQRGTPMPRALRDIVHGIKKIAAAATDDTASEEAEKFDSEKHEIERWGDGE